MTPERWARIKSVFGEALERKEEERGAFLEEAFGQDTELRHEVESLLRGRDDITELHSPVNQQDWIGRTISHYRIVEKLGEGGMGVVYKAEDTRLHRVVALKFLRPDSVESREAKARFLNEAEAAASLDHPNICTIHEIDEAEGRAFLVMAFVEGLTVAHKIRQRPLPLEEALEIASQVTKGLNAAHTNGIVHRDIKPSNVMVDAEGRVTVMDFGLAHLAGATTITKTGTVLGTPAYMSPEQVRGDAADHRTDIWSLGVVVYEMVTGRLPFRGDSVQSVALAIQNSRPEPITAQRAGVPIEMEWIVGKAVAKVPGERYQHVDEMGVDLQGLRRKMEAATVTTDAGQNKALLAPATTLQRPASRRQRAVPWIVAGLAILAAFLSWNRSGTGVPLPAGVIRFSIPVSWSGSPGVSSTYTQQPSVAISPDGSRFVFVAREGLHQQLYVRAMDADETRPIPGTDDARSPFFSPDGDSVAFFTSRNLKRVSLVTNAVATICEVLPLALAGTWTGDDTILFTAIPGGGLKEVPVGGGQPEALTQPLIDQGEWGHRYPRILPTGKAVLFAIGNPSGWFDASPAVLSFETGKWRRLLDTGTSPQFMPPRYLVYAWAGALYAVVFDPERWEITGQPMKVLDGVRTAMGGDFGISENGSLVYLAATRDWLSSRLVVVDRKGSQSALDFPVGGYTNPRFSPDGRLIAVSILDEDDGNFHIGIGDPVRGTLRHLTSTPGVHRLVAWTADGKAVVDGFGHMGPPDLYWRPADGSETEERLLEREHAQFPASCSMDGRTLLFIDEHPNSNLDLWVLSLKERKPQPFAHTEFNETAGSFSPDGQWVAYQSDESGRYEDYVRPVSDAVLGFQSRS